MAYRKFRCPVCLSLNTSTSVRPASTNAVLSCSGCNFFEVLFYGESTLEAIAYLEAVGAVRAKRPTKLRYKTRQQLPKLRIREYRKSAKTRRQFLVFLQKMWARMVGRSDHWRLVFHSAIMHLMSS